jgi:ABC-2 type transport system permease protein
MPEHTQLTWSATRSSAQYRAIAWLRWRIFINTFRRKGSAGDIFATIIVIPFAAVVLIGPAFGAGFLAGLFAYKGHLDNIAFILWAAFVFCQFLNIQLGQPGTTFDPTQLIRFPLSISNYTAVRLFFGILAPANISAVLVALAVATGVTVALPQLAGYAFLAMLAFAAANVLFSRMLFAWVDRWLSTRRAREVFTALIFTFSLGIQWLNLTFNPAYHHNRHGINSSTLSQEKIDAVTRLYHHILPWIAGFPPNLTTSALQAALAGAHLQYFLYVLGSALYAAAFYAVFAWRTRTEYRGENFSDQANAVAKPIAAAATAPAFTSAPATQPASLHADTLQPSATLSPHAAQRGIIGTMLGKEFLTLRRNTGIAYGLLAPIFLVFIFAFKLAAGKHYPWLFPAATVYALMGVVPLGYNTFGLEGPGVQFHFMAPVRLRDVILSKNIMSIALAALDLALVFAVISYVSGLPSLRMTLAGVFWAAAMVFLSLTIGNRRSITAPKKIEPGRSASKQASPLSSLISFFTLVVGAGFGALLFFAEAWLHTNLLLVPILALAALASFLVYRHSLATIDSFAYDNREQLFDELCKK